MPKQLSQNLPILIMLTLCLSACGQDYEAPTAPQLSPAEFVQAERLAAKGDAEAIKEILVSISTTGGPHFWEETLKWSDRLARLGDVEGYYGAAEARFAIANRMATDNPERLILLTEAQYFGNLAAKSDPEVYGRQSIENEWLKAEVAASEEALDGRFGPLPAENHAARR